jgi:Ca2+-binding EF-hand superfamily protein
MRRISAMAVIGLLVAAQGCTINIPGNLLTQITATPRASATPPPANNCDAAFSVRDVSQDGMLTEGEFNAHPMGNGKQSRFADLDRDGDGVVSRIEYLQGCEMTVTKASPKPSKPPIATGTFYGMANCDHALKKFDTDRDERLSPGEYAVWQLGFQAPAQPAVCAVPGAIAPSFGPDYRVLRAPMVMPSPSAMPVCEPPQPTVVLPPFEKWDHNRDQFIDRAELCEAAGTVPPPPPPRPVCEDTFKHVDRNGDGTISPEEYFSGDFAPPLPDGMAKPGVMPTEGELAARFKALDANADGRLDPREYCADWGTAILPSPAPTPRWDDCYGMVKSYDRNQDGQVTWEEYYEGFLLPISARYDGQKDEVYARFKGLDRNGDGVLSSDEYCPPDAQPTATPTPAPTETARTDDANR